MSDTSREAGRGAVTVSVILPTYNRAALLPRSIDSVLRQTFGDFELIVVDDGSVDNTADVVRACGDSRVRYLQLDRNRGLAAARNAGMAVACGAFLAFQDSDDEWHPDKLSRQLDAMEAHPAAAVVYSDMVRQLQDGRRLRFRSPAVVKARLVNPRTRFWQTYMLAMQPALVRRSLAGYLRFDERLALFEDLDFHLRLAYRQDYVHLQEPLVTYHETPGMTAGGSLEARARRALLRKYFRELSDEAPGFLAREAAAILLRRSLMPVVRQHLEPM